MLEYANASAKKPGGNGGADSKKGGAVGGNEDRSMHNVRAEYVRATVCLPYTGFSDEEVHSTPAWLVAREHEPEKRD